MTYRDVKLHAFDLKFSVNMTIPPYVGIGKAVSVGNGVVRRIKSLTNSYNHSIRKDKVETTENYKI